MKAKNQATVAKATLGRLPIYLNYLKTLQGQQTISATTISKALRLGEVQVRKDLNAVSGAGKPRIGYITSELQQKIECFLGQDQKTCAIIAGAGKLGSALLNYNEFEEFGVTILAGFDNNSEKVEKDICGKEIYPMENLEQFCKLFEIHIGIIAVPKSAAQQVCDQMVKAGIGAIWNFAPCSLRVPENVMVQHENLALSLAHLNLQMKTK